MSKSNVPQCRIALVLLCFAVFVTGCTTAKLTTVEETRQITKPITTDTPSSTPIKKPIVISVAAVGDIMLGTDFPTDRLPAAESVSLLQNVAPILQAADIAFGNLEGVLLDGGQLAKRCRNPKLCYAFRTPTRYGHWLKQAGFDVMSLANNHARDFGEHGREMTMQTLDKLGILHSGRHGGIARWQLKGRRVAMVAYAPFVGSNDLLDVAAATKTIMQLAKNHDIILVSMHAGAEGLDATRLPFAREYYHNEDRGDVVAFARAVIDAGADLVLGHGPHVPRAIELYKGRLIAYSLGNFSTYFGISVSGAKGLAPILWAKLNQEGAFVSGQIISARQLRPSGPMLDTSHAAANFIANLSQQDFPNMPLVFSADGHITIKSLLDNQSVSPPVTKQPVSNRN